MVKRFLLYSQAYIRLVYIDLELGKVKIENFIVIFHGCIMKHIVKMLSLCVLLVIIPTNWVMISNEFDDPLNLWIIDFYLKLNTGRYD